MPTISMKLSQAEIKDAVRLYVESKGFVATDRFGVTVDVIPGDRPFESGYTEINVFGVSVK